MYVFEKLNNWLITILKILDISAQNKNMITPFFKFEFSLGKPLISEKNAIPTKNMQTSANLQNEPYIRISAKAGGRFVKRMYVTSKSHKKRVLFTKFSVNISIILVRCFNNFDKNTKP